MNPSSTRETDYGCTKSPPSEESKFTMDVHRQPGYLGCHNIGGDHIGYMAH